MRAAEANRAGRRNFTSEQLVSHCMPRRLQTFVSCAALCLLPLVLSCSSSNSAATAVSTPTPVPTPTPATAPTWVVAWGASPENALAGAENSGGSEQSFRSFFLPTVAGTEERVHFSNLFGTTPLVIGSARLALAGSTAGQTAAIDSTHDVALTFNGAVGVTIPAGQEIVSDSVNIIYTFGQKMAVTFYLSGSFPALTQHESQVTTNYATPVGAGDTTTDAAGEAFTTANTEWFVATGVDVYGAYGGTVAIFGSSSVDGHASNFGDTNSYPVANGPIPTQDNDRPSDWLARELNAAGYNLGVLNAGTIGDPAGEDSRTLPTPGAGAIAGVDRMKHDVLDQPGIKAVIIYFGGIDVRSDCLPATSVEVSLMNMVAQAQAAGIRVILATLPPSEYCQSATPLPSTADPYAGDLNPGPENPGSTQRRALNTWIRTTGATLPGVVAIADFDQALADPNHPDFMIANLNSGDNFHPNGVGYGVQSAAIPLLSILGQ